MLAMLTKMAAGDPASRTAASALSPRRSSISRPAATAASKVLLAAAAAGAAPSRLPPERKVDPVQAAALAVDSERHNAGDIELQDA
jgi:hypothetical protein